MTAHLLDLVDTVRALLECPHAPADVEALAEGYWCRRCGAADLGNGSWTRPELARWAAETLPPPPTDSPSPDPSAPATLTVKL
jgi:hypothetical protein